MTLLHTVLSARMAALRHATDQTWPTTTAFSAHDVIIDGTSLAYVARRSTTPVVYHPLSADLGRLDRIWGAQARSVVLARVEDVVPRLAGAARQVWIDADLDACAAVVEQARLVGRASTASVRRFTVHPAPGRAGRLARLPEDVHRDDVLAIPCLGVVQTDEVHR